MTSFVQVLNSLQNRGCCALNRRVARFVVVSRCVARFAFLPLVALLVLCHMLGVECYGQNPTTKKKSEKSEKSVKPGAKASKGGAAELAPPSPFEELDFGAVKGPQAADNASVDMDSTSDGQQRLAKIESQVKDIFTERAQVDKERQPIVARRDRLLEDVLQLNQGIVRAQQGVQQAQNEIRRLNGLVNNNNAQSIRDEIQVLEDQIFATNLVITGNQRRLADKSGDLKEANAEIEPFDKQLLKLWLDLNRCREQWLEIRQPQQKYAYGHYESLKQAIDEWVLLDGLWPEAYCWAALCSYELGEYDAAWAHMDRAAALRENLRFQKAWAQGEALRGMIAAKIKERRSKSENHLQLANLYVGKEKSTNWVVFFLMGRAALENDKMAGKAKMNFEKALKINADAACVKYWYARLQTNTTVPAIRNVDSGTKALEELWKQSTRKSWRLAQSLVLAYDTARREADADATWDLVQTLAPKSMHETLQHEREVQAKINAQAGDSSATKTKKSESNKGKTAEKTSD